MQAHLLSNIFFVAKYSGILAKNSVICVKHTGIWCKDSGSLGKYSGFGSIALLMGVKNYFNVFFLSNTVFIFIV